MTARLEYVEGVGPVEFPADEQIARMLVLDNLDRVGEFFEDRPDENERHADWLTTRAKVHARDYAGAIESAKPLAAYFAANAEADHDGERYVPNDEMRAGQYLAAAIAQLERLAERVR